MTPRRVTGILLAVAQLSTGAYLVIYLYRWQWNRALICGVLFIATEVLIIGRLILQRLRSLEDRIESSSPSTEALRRSLVETRPPPTDRFAWLQEASSRTNVFLPVLLGAGVLASALAWLVETVARRTARPAVERSLATAMAPLSFPAGGFVGPATAAAPRRRTPLSQRVALGVAVAIVAVGIGALVDVVADATQTRPDRLDKGATTVLDLQFRGSRAVADPGRHASNLMAACSPVFGRDVPTIAVVTSGGGRARVVLDADLGEHGTVRLRGCLEDTTFASVQASVIEVIEVPPPRG